MSFQSSFRLCYQAAMVLTILLLIVIFNTATYNHQLLLSFCILGIPAGIIYSRAVSKVVLQDITLIVCRGFSKYAIAYSTIKSAKMMGSIERAGYNRGKRIELVLENNKVKSFHLEDGELFLEELHRHIARVS